ncbi:hypothetical protein XAC2852_720129 [Xanthomonas citri pv. citri]|nr:hypothetical protein XAC2852_720129 [Xanthomonas citri pv. citri]
MPEVIATKGRGRSARRVGPQKEVHAGVDVLIDLGAGGLAVQAAHHQGVELALEQAEELRGGACDVRDLQLAVGHPCRQEIRQRPLRALGACIPEHLADMHVAGPRRHHHAVGGDGRFGADHGEERMGDLGELVAQCALGRVIEQVVRHHVLALCADRLGKQALLVAEVAVHGQFGDAGLCGDPIHADPCIALLHEHGAGGTEDGGTLSKILGTTRAVALGLGIERGRAGHAVNTRPSGSIFILGAEPVR